MPAFVIALVRADDLDARPLQEYRSANSALVERHGGRFVVRGGAVGLEGASPDRVVVIEFADLAAARGWYEDPDYQAIAGLRRSASDTDIMLVEGV